MAVGVIFGSFWATFSNKTAVREVSSHRGASMQYYDFLAVRKLAEPAPTEPKPTPIDQGELRKTFCSDPTIRPIWKLITRDPDVREALAYVWSPFGNPDCKTMFELKYVDLDRDGREEILVRGGGSALCGAVGNCDFWVIKRGRKGLRVLLHADDYTDATEMGKQVLKARTNGYADLLLKGHFSASATSYSTYEYNGRRYVESQCRYHVPNYNHPQYDTENPRWHFISCTKFSRNLNN